MKTILVDAINTFVIKGEGIFDKMHTLLEQYPNEKIIVTNANDEQMKIFRLHDMPYEVFTLKHNPDKTDPQYYTTLLEHTGLNADEVIYFEHNKDAIESARSIGINTFYYNPDTKDLTTLQTFLDENL